MKINRFPRLLIVVAGLMFLSGQAAFAQRQPELSDQEGDFAAPYPGYFEIGTDTVRAYFKGVTEEPDMRYVTRAESPKPLNELLVSIGQVVNIAKTAWKIVVAGKPAVNIGSNYATAYPEGITAASQLSGWSKPRGYVYGFYAENLYGAVTVDVMYKVVYAYNGNYKGTGKYLTGVTIIPTKIQVARGYKFDMSVSVPDSTVANVGTDLAPVAAMQLKLDWKIKTALKETDGTSVYYMEGNGHFAEIASPWRGKALTRQELVPAAPILDQAKVF